MSAFKFLTGLCGGDDGEDSEPPRLLVAPTVEPLPPCRAGISHLYFGSNDAQVTETDDHVNRLFASWSDDKGLADRIRVAAMPTILDVSDLLFTEGNPRRYVGAQGCVENVRRRLDTLTDNNGRVPYVDALYVIDEPEREANVPACVIEQVCADLRIAVESHFEKDKTPALHVCYGDGEDYRGINALDWVGFDDYDENNVGRFARFKAQLRPEQRIVLYSGGANPYREDPRAFYELAQRDEQVIAVCSFLWVRYKGPDGKMQDGIRDNGMADAYRAVGKAIIQGNS